MNTMHVTKPMLNAAPPVADDEIDLMALVATLWRGKWIVALCCGLAILLGGLYAFKVATPMYPARAVVALETKEQAVVDIESVLSGASGGSEEVNTEVEVLRSRTLMSRLVDRLDLIKDPEFNKHLREPGLLAKIMGSRQAPTPTEEKNDVIDAVLKVIGVTNIRQSLVFSISVTTENADKSAAIANALADIYIQDALDEKRDATETASVWLSQKASELKVELEASELEVTKFKEEIQLVSPEALAILSVQLKELRQRLSDLAERKQATEDRLASLRSAQVSGDMATVAAVANDARLTSFANAGEAEAFDARLNTVLSQLQAETIRNTQQYETLVKSEETFRADIESQSADLVQLQQLTREAQANGLLYESFLTRLKETSVQKGLQTPDSRLLSEAVPRPASAPRKGMILVLSALLGGLAGSALVLLQELRNSSFRSADDLENFTGYKVLGSIPSVKTNTRLGVLDYAIDKPTSAFAEAVRNLRTSVLLSNPDHPPQMIMSTSSVPGEGKTTQSLTLAQNMAGLGKRVLVLEGDVRKRIFSEYFDTSVRPGFLSVMSGDATLEEAVFHHEKMGIDLLFGEKSNVNAADIFSSNRFTDFLKKLREEYDYIVVDTAPVLAVPDARIVGQHMDAIMYSVLWDRTTKAQVKEGLSMFASVGLRVSGLVLSNVNLKQLKKYGQGGAYSYSGYYEN